MSLFKLRGRLDSKTKLLLEIGGVVLLIVFWTIMAHLLSQVNTISSDEYLDTSIAISEADSAANNAVIKTNAAPTEERVYPILPPPIKVVGAFGELHRDNNLIGNTGRSLMLNILGYLEAIAIALPLGFIIGLFPLFRGLFSRQVDAFRFVPLNAVTGLFIIWFGIDTPMKVHFLALGIIVYLLPVVVQRIDEVKEVYLKTAYTLGATNWQTIRTVYIPSVLSRISDDIRVLTAISWTYIIIAESINSNAGGLGALIYKAGQRQGRIDKVFALLVVIILIGFIQDKLFLLLDRWLFPFKYIEKHRK